MVDSATLPTVSSSNYRKLLIASATSNLGDGISFVAIPLLATSLTRDPMLVAGVSLAYAGARLVASPFSGVVADRTDRRRLMVMANTARGVVLLGLAGLVAVDLATIPVLYAVFVVLGAFETLVDVSAFALLPAVVSSDQLTRANGQLAGAQTVLDEFVGPPLGGLLLGMSLALPLAVDAVTFLLAALLVAWIQGSFRPAVEAEHQVDAGTIRQELVAGLRYLLSERMLVALAVSNFLSTVSYMAPFAVLALWATQTIGLSPTEYGIVLTVSALGSLLGALLATRVERRLGAPATLRVMLGLGVMSYVALALTTNPAAVATLLGLYFFHTSVWTICFASMRQRLIPDQLMGRVSGAMRSFGLAGLVVGAAAGGVLAARFGLQAPFWFGAGLLVVALLLPLGQQQNELTRPQ